MILQWEIFDILSKKTKFERQSTNASLVLEDHGFQIRNYKWNQCSLFRIGLKKSSKKRYLSTNDIVKIGLQTIRQVDQVGLIAQAWHAPRCDSLLKQGGINITAGRFIPGFNEDDPKQKWVRDYLSWIIKESSSK